jgi:integrase
MASTTSLPDPAALYISRLGTPHSRATARSALRAVARLLGVMHIDWAALTYADLAGVRAGLNGYSSCWGGTCWTVTRQCLIEARRLGCADPRLVDDVLALPRLRGTSGRLGRDIEDDEVAALISTVTPDSVRNRRDGALLALLVFGGLRRSECIGVAVQDWDRAARLLTVRNGKGRKTRTVPLPTTAARLIDRWLQVHLEDGQLLRSVDRWEHIGNKLSAAAIPKILEQLSRLTGVAPVSAHAFRARRITQVISAADPLLAQRFAGHSSTATTAIYDRRSTDALADVVDRLEVDQTGRESVQSPVHASTVWTPSAIRNTAICPNSAPMALAS